MTAHELKRYTDTTTADGMIETPHGEYVRLTDVEAYTKAAIAEAMMGAVKPLEWDGDYGRSAANPWGGYHITDREGLNQDYDWFGWRHSSRGDFDESEEDYPTIEAAQAAAEADWQARNAAIRVIPTYAMVALAERERLAEQRGFDRAKNKAAQIAHSFMQHLRAGHAPMSYDLAAAIRAMEGGE